MSSLSDDIVRTLTAYSEDVQKQIAESLTALGGQAKIRLQEASPVRTGKYARGWRLKETVKDGAVSITVKQSGQNGKLTHLLENGHLARDGITPVAAQPHIDPVQEWLNTEGQKAIEKAVSG